MQDNIYRLSGGWVVIRKNMKSLKKIFFVKLLILLGVQGFSQRKGFRPKKIVFDKTTIYDSSGSKTMDSLTTSMESDFQFLADSDSAWKVLKYELKEISDFIKMESEISEQRVVETIRDTLWAYTIKGGNIRGMERIDKVGQMHSYTNDKRREGTGPVEVSLNRDDRLKIFKKDREKILGIRCYKIVLELIQEGELGNTIYEMYVTKKIKLPLHALVWVDKDYAFFPLEVKRYMKKYPGIIEKWQAMSIVR